MKLSDCILIRSVSANKLMFFIQQDWPYERSCMGYDREVNIGIM
jgi:hypothetical protein